MAKNGPEWHRLWKVIVKGNCGERTMYVVADSIGDALLVANDAASVAGSESWPDKDAEAISIAPAFGFNDKVFVNPDFLL